MAKVANLNYGKRNDDIRAYFREKGIEPSGNGKRDIHFNKIVHITDEVSLFAIYALGTDSEKDVFLKIFEKYNPILGSVKREPEPSNLRKCCARWKHSSKDYEIMLHVVSDILEASVGI